MPIVRGPEDLPVTRGEGYTETEVAGPDVFGTPVPMRARRFVVEPGASAPIELTSTEAMLYVVDGAGVLEVGSDAHHLARESMVWVEPPASATLRAGDEGVEVLVSEAPGR